MTVESSLATLIEQVFIEYFNSEPSLREYRARHYEDDAQADTPDIMVKVVVNKFIDSPSDPKQRLYKAECDFQVRGNIAKVSAEGYDRAMAKVEDMIGNITSYKAQFLACPSTSRLSHFSTIDEEGGNEREDDEKRRKGCRKLWLVVQEKC